MEKIFTEEDVRSLLKFVGEDPQRQGLEDTPSRVLKSLKELTGGYAQCPAKILATTFPTEGYCSPVVLRGIQFSSLCEHHLLPFCGTASVGYVSADQIVGLSKLARLVDCLSRRLQIQERLTLQIAQAINKHLQPKGIGIVLRGRHQCLACRGARQTDAEMITVQFLGETDLLRQILLA